MRSNYSKEDLIRYRIEEAEKTIQEITVLISNDLYKTAVNRIYYGMFYMLLALALKHDYKTSKHRQLIGWFNQIFIKPGMINKKYGKMINHAFESRTDSDYGIFAEFSREELEEMHKEMMDFIEELKKHVL